MLRHIKSGKIKTVPSICGRSYAITREEIDRVSGYSEEASRHVEYDGRRVPFFYYLIFLLISYHNDYDEISAALIRFRFPVQSKPVLDKLWTSILSTCNPSMKNTLSHKRPATGNKYFDEWAESLGILPLFEEVLFPCNTLLLDHSNARIDIEAMIGGRVALVEIHEYTINRYGKFYGVDALKFFQYYFYNVSEFTSLEYMCYIRTFGNHEEMTAKKNAWDSPGKAKALLKIPGRFDFEANINRTAEYTMSLVDEMMSGNYHDVGVLKTLADTLVKMQGSMSKVAKENEDRQQKALSEAAAEDFNINIETPEVERVLYEDLEQELPTEQTEENNGEYSFKKGTA